MERGFPNIEMSSLLSVAQKADLELFSEGKKTRIKLSLSLVRSCSANS